MSLESEKIDLVKRLVNINQPSIVRRMNDILDKEEVVAYTVGGKPLTKAQYMDEIKKAEKDIELGNVLTTEELREEIKKW